MKYFELNNILQIIIAFSLLIFIYKRKGFFCKILSLYMIATVVMGIYLINISQLIYFKSILDLKNNMKIVSNIFLIGTISSFFGMLVVNRSKKYFYNNIVYFNHKKLNTILIIYSFLGIIILLFVFYIIGYVPLFYHNTNLAKYFSDSTDIYVSYRPLYNIGLTLLTFTLSLLMCFFFDLENKKLKRRTFFLVLFVLGSLVCSMKRAAFLVPFLILFGSLALSQRISFLRFSIYMGILALVGVIAWFVRNLQNFSFLDVNFFYGLSNNLFVELREMVRILSWLGNSFEPAYGKTYLAGLFSLVPSSLWSFKDDYYLGRFVFRILGINPDIAGAPRVSMFGEAWLNFRYVGVSLVGFMFGVSVAYYESWAMKIVAENKQNTVLLGLIFLFFFQFFFAFYTSGSPCFQRIQIMGIFTIPIFCFCLTSKRIKTG